MLYELFVLQFSLTILIFLVAICVHLKGMSGDINYMMFAPILCFLSMLLFWTLTPHMANIEIHTAVPQEYVYNSTYAQINSSTVDHTYTYSGGHPLAWLYWGLGAVMMCIGIYDIFVPIKQYAQGEFRDDAESGRSIQVRK